MSSATKPRFSLRVFISSTFSDLEAYRQAAFEAIQSLGAHGDDMIYWSADERDAGKHSVERVRQCDVVILLLAHRYGFVAPGSPCSITELEYQAAREAGIPVLAYFVDENQPWPPAQVEWEKAQQLAAFKRRVECEVTRKLFRSPDELGRLVTQALALFMERHREGAAQAARFTGSAVRVDASTAIKIQPDTTVHIGQTEDGLPLVLGIKRSRDFGQQMESLASAMTGSGPSAAALLSSFRQSLEAHSKDGWARERLFQVSFAGGPRRELYVTNANLSQLFRSSFASILACARSGGAAHSPQPPREPQEWVSVIMAQTVRDPSVTRQAALESEGGRNRFLGIDPLTGEVFSVGWRNDECVAWRSFVFESVVAALPSASFQVRSRAGTSGALSALPTTLLNLAAGNDSSELDTSISIRIPRQEVLLLMAEVVERVAQMHARGIIHGDLKPHNVLLGTKGPELIDAFNLAEGDVSPGWTPNWSAPEQILGEGVTSTCDIYPIGKMISDVLGGELVGEVRKFKARPIDSEMGEFDVFYNPSIFLRSPVERREAKSLAAWATLGRQCLRFSPADRPTSAAVLAQRMRELAYEHPLAGELTLSFGGQLVVVDLPDGSQAVARLIRDRTSSADIPTTSPEQWAMHDGFIPGATQSAKSGTRMRQCDAGHYFDFALNRSCPHCEAEK